MGRCKCFAKMAANGLDREKVHDNRWGSNFIQKPFARHLQTMLFLEVMDLCFAPTVTVCRYCLRASRYVQMILTAIQWLTKRSW